MKAVPLEESESPGAAPTLGVMTGVDVRIFAFLAVLALATPAFADEVVLRNGAVFTGVVREEGDRVVLHLDFGTMTFKRIDVRSIVKSDDPLKELDRRMKDVEGAQGHYDLAIWARDKGLTNRSNDLLRKAIEIEPDHAGARKALGYEKVEGRWLEGDPLKVALGLVKHNGRWLPRETVERLLENEKQVLIESDRRAIERRAIDTQREVELAKIALERQKLEAERERDRWGWSWSGGYLWGCWVPAACRCSGAHSCGVWRSSMRGLHGEPLPPVRQTVVPHSAPTVVPIPPPSPLPPPRPN